MKQNEDIWMVQRIVVADLMGLDSRPYWNGAVNSNDENTVNDLVADQKHSLIPEKIGLKSGEWPYPIITSIRKMLDESADAKYRVLHRLIDSFEVLIKYIASIMISDILQREQLTEDMRKLFVKTLKIPLLGHWVEYTRVATMEMSLWKSPPFVPEIIDYYNYYIKYKADSLLGLRNIIAHSSTPEESTSSAYIQEQLPNLVFLLLGAQFLKHYELFYQADNKLYRATGITPVPSHSSHTFENGDVVLFKSDTSNYLKISPLLRYHRGEEEEHYNNKAHQNKDSPVRLVFYNDQKYKDTIHYLSYENARHFFDSKIYSRFIEFFPLADWRTKEIEREVNDFIDAQVEDFVGRQNTISEILTWIESQSSGFLLIEGLPGTGKSSIAAVLNRKTLVESLFTSVPKIKSGSKAAAILQNPIEILNKTRILPYFIKRNDVSTRPHKFLTDLQDMLSSILNVGFKAKGTDYELLTKFNEKVRAAAQKLSQSQEKLVFLIDGLDEAGMGESILNFLPKGGLPENTYFIFTARPRKEIVEFYHSLDREKRCKITISGLSKGNIREFLYESVSKYDLDEPYVEKIIEKSEGNPLYLKLLLSQLREGSKEINRLDTIPNTIYEVYDSTVAQILTQDREVLPVLLLLSVARESLSMDDINGILGIDDIVYTGELIGLCSEVLTKEKNEKGEEVYRVFHDTFAEYCVYHPNYRKKLNDIKKRILTFEVEQRGFDYNEEIRRIIDTLIDLKPLEKSVAETTTKIVISSAKKLTPRYIIVQSLLCRPFTEVSFLFHAFLNHVDPTIATLTVQCLIEFGRKVPMKLISFMENVSEREITRIEREGLNQDRILSLQLTINVLSEVSVVEETHTRLKHILLRLCRHRNESVLMLGVNGVYRISQINQKLSMNILIELAEESLWHRLPNLPHIKPFVGSALAVYFDPQENHKLNDFLYEQVKNILKRVYGLKLALWFLPSIMSTFLAKVPEDYNPNNLYELRQSRKIVRRKPPILDPLLRVTELIDPAEGYDEELEDIALNSLNPHVVRPEHGTLFLPLGSAFISRSIVDGGKALETAYKYWDMWKDTEFVFNQDIISALHLIDMGKRMQGQEQLDDSWCVKAEEIMRHYFYRMGARFRLVHEYRTLPGINFIIENRGEAEQPIVGELIDYVCKVDMDTLDQDQVKKDLSDVILRCFEVLALEYGVNNTLYRDVTYFGIRQYIGHYEKLGDATLNFIVKILARMRFYHMFEVDNFLHSLPKTAKQDFKRRIGTQFPLEDIGTLLSMRGTYKYVSLLAEPAGKKDGLRGKWQDFCRLVLTEEKMASLLRGMGRSFFNIFGE